MSTYAETIKDMEASCGQSSNWSDISPEYAARMRLQNRFKTGLDIARYTAAIMRKDTSCWSVRGDQTMGAEAKSASSI